MNLVRYLLTPSPVRLSFVELASALVSVVYRYQRSSRLMSIWKMCADESYAGRWFVIGGVVATQEHWKWFEKEWSRVLAARNPRPLPYFTKKDAGRLDRKDSVMYGWTRAQVERKSKALGRVLEEMDGRIAHYIDRVYLDRLMQRTSIPARYCEPYHVGFFQALRLTAEFMNHQDGEQEQPRMVFDHRDARIRHTALDIYDVVREAKPSDGDIYHIGKWLMVQPQWLHDCARPGKERDVDIGLQAADVITWHLMDGLRRADLGEEWAPPAFMQKDILSSGNMNPASYEQWKWTTRNLAVSLGDLEDSRVPFDWEEPPEKRRSRRLGPTSRRKRGAF